ncbi:Eco57I restriction-modification methylase domain-containing protein [Sandarakinorhabdus sp.]|uniref:Eco57I restriction-modification methylase domain-containing protein n=1 Tax=Sandarakinorhabdus sp. TaxID=1916663 RepID=UPI003F70CEDE
MTYRRGRLLSDYFLSEGIRSHPEYLAITDAEVAASRAMLLAHMNAIAAMAAPSEAQTEADLIQPTIAALGWADTVVQAATDKRRTGIPDYALFADATAKATAAALANPGERFRHAESILEAKGWGVALDKGSGALGEGVPSSQILRYLSAVEVLSDRRIRFGILTNGSLWRLYDQRATSRAEDFLEIDLAALLAKDLPWRAPDLLNPDATEQAHGIRLFLVVFGRNTIAADAAGNVTLAGLLDENRRFEARLTDDLASRVFNDVYAQLAGALAAADPQRPAAMGEAYLAELRDASQTYLYRLLFVLYAEDRDLLPTRHPGYDDYSLDKRLRGEIAARLDRADAFSATRKDLDRHLRGLWEQIDKGDRSIGLPPYNGGLFAEARSPLLNRAILPDAAFAPIFDALSRTEADGQRRRLNYRDLSVQHLGSIYERLLDFDLVADGTAIAARLQPFARKNTGSYYTPESLVMLVIRRTVGPLLAERRAAFSDAAKAMAGGHPRKSERLAKLAALDPATNFLDLKICDPAMGSGHFLVSLVDYLADATLAAMAEAPDLVAWGEYASPLGARLEAVRLRIRELAEANGWAVRDEQLDQRQLVRRMILKRVIYGVDKNPMAVELAKLSLWLHSFTVGAPLSFLDHHLRCGDSLFGEWVRPAMDRLSAGGLFANNAVAAAQGAVAGMARVEELTDSDVAEVHESAAQYRAIQDDTAPLRSMLDALHGLAWKGEEIDAARKRIRKAKATLRAAQVQGATGAHVAATALSELKALERKANVGQVWLEGGFGDPVFAAATFYGKQNDPDPELAFLGQAAAIAAEERFFHWEVGFPGVWQNWASAQPEGGFDAIIGNPPWDRLKLQEIEWFEARAPGIAKAQRASDRKRMIADLAKAGDPLADAFARVAARTNQAMRMTGLCEKDGGQFPLMGGGDVNLYSLFVERANRLVKRDGMVGLLVPSGIAADLGAAPFFRAISTSGRLATLLDFENRAHKPNGFFPDVDNRFKFCAFIAGGEQRTFPAAECGFYLQGTDDAVLAAQTYPMTAADFDRVNPNTGNAPIFRTRRDAELTRTIYERVPVLVDRRHSPPRASWPTRYATMFHMAGDSGRFRTAEELAAKEGAWPIDGNRWKSASGEWYPLFEGKMVQAFDHRAADITINEENVFRPGQQASLSAADHADPHRSAKPRYWIQVGEKDWPAPTDWALAFKDVTASSNVRTVIAAIVPKAGAGHTLPLVVPDPAANLIKADAVFQQVALAANFNAMAFDYSARQKVNTNHLVWYLLEQLPILPPAAYTQPLGAMTAGDMVKREVLRLTYTAHDLAAFCRDLGHDGLPFPWDETDRRHRRARLDALFFILYGIGREDADYILSTFPIVEREDRAAHGRYFTRDLILAYMNALAAGDTESVVAI